MTEYFQAYMYSLGVLAWTITLLFFYKIIKVVGGEK